LDYLVTFYTANQPANLASYCLSIAELLEYFALALMLHEKLVFKHYSLPIIPNMSTIPIVAKDLFTWDPVSNTYVKLPSCDVAAVAGGLQSGSGNAGSGNIPITLTSLLNRRKDYGQSEVKEKQSQTPQGSGADFSQSYKSKSINQTHVRRHQSQDRSPSYNNSRYSPVSRHQRQNENSPSGSPGNRNSPGNYRSSRHENSPGKLQNGGFYRANRPPEDGGSALKFNKHESGHQRRDRESHSEKLNHHGVTMRDQSQILKGRKKKKIFRNSLTFPVDLCDLETGEKTNITDHSNSGQNGTKKKTKKSKRFCDIHGPRRGSGQGTIPGFDFHKESSPSLYDNLLVCTCKSRRTKRPDPEGGSSILPYKKQTEYDKIIYNDDPIFSDYGGDDDDDTVEEQIRTESERYHKRSHHSDIFAAAQMVNSNNMLKFAIIGTELTNIINIIRRSEGEVQALTRRIRLLEEDFEQTETRLQSASEKLEEASKAADESERARKVLENRQINDDERIASLDKELEDTIFQGEEADRKYEEAARKLAVTEVDLERAEARLEAAEAKILELEEELKVVGNNMKSLEISEQEASQREDSYEESIRDLTARLKDAENRATEAERTVSKLQKEVDRLEDELLAEKEKYKGISEDLDTTFAELAGF